MVSTVVPESSTPAFFSGGAEGPGSPAARLLPIPDMVAEAYRLLLSLSSSWTLKNTIKKPQQTQSTQFMFFNILIHHGNKMLHTVQTM